MSKNENMKVILKSGEYYDYYSIKRVEILEDYIIKITGNFKKGERSKTTQLHLRAIKNIREFNRFLKNEMKRFDVEGACPHCSSLNIKESGHTIYHKDVNEPKSKIRYEEGIFGHYYCNYCKKQSKELKPVDLVIFYK